MNSSSLIHILRFWWVNKCVNRTYLWIVFVQDEGDFQSLNLCCWIGHWWCCLAPQHCRQGTVVKTDEGAASGNLSVRPSRCFRSSQRRRGPAVGKQMETSKCECNVYMNLHTEQTTQKRADKLTSSSRSSGRLTLQFPSMHSSVICPSFSSFGSIASVSMCVRAFILLQVCAHRKPTESNTFSFQCADNCSWCVCLPVIQLANTVGLQLCNSHVVKQHITNMREDSPMSKH